MAEGKTGDDEPIVIKKYANRRLYNTSTSSYVTLDHLSQLVKDGIVFVVLDAKGGDITRAVLTQIIVEEEGKGDNLLPINFLRQLISFYGDNMQRMLLPHYLEHSIDAFARNQDSIQQYMQETFGSMFPFGGIEEMGKQNMAMFESAMKMFTPFPNGGEAEGGAAQGGAAEGGAAQGPAKEGPAEGGPAASAAAAAPVAESGTDVEALKRQLGEIQRQIDAMTAKPK